MIRFDQPHHEYLSDPAIGSHTARHALDSIQLVRDERDGLIVRAPSRALTFGTVAHAKFLQPQIFADMLGTGPINPKTGRCYGQETKAFAEWADANPGKVVLNDSELKGLDGMASRMPEQIRAILATPGAMAEASVYQTITDVAAKCRPDLLDVDGAMITDLKTIDDIGGIRHAMKSYGYWFQQEWYKRVLFAETGKRFAFRFIFAEKSPPYRWRIVTTTQEVCEEGAAIVSGVLIMLRDAAKSGDWSDKGGITQEITWPDCGHFEDVA
jgi:hypothetical protein